MSTPQRDWVSKWAPLVVALATNCALVAYGYGQLNQRLVPLERHESKAFETFVTRAEFSQRSTTRDVELAQLHQLLRDLNAKMDRLLEKQRVGE